MLLVPIPWAARAWALPFLTVLAPSGRYTPLHRRRHETVPDEARQMLLSLHRRARQMPRASSRAWALG